MHGNYLFFDDEKVENAINNVDQLPDDIDVTYTKSDVGESEVVKNVVENDFKYEKQNDSTQYDISRSQDEMRVFTRFI
ncbi:hypothetical protein Hanom_Chr08g00724591 [Helianthus anomalus]